MSTPSLAALYPAHLDTLQARTAEALRRGGFDHLVIPSGTLHYQAFDDRDYPYAVNPQFKAWLPLTQAPGSWLVITPGKRPALIFLQPRDYWHAVPAMPREYWVEINRLLVPFGKHVCTGVRPRCSTCPLLDMCAQVGVTEHR